MTDLNSWGRQKEGKAGLEFGAKSLTRYGFLQEFQGISVCGANHPQGCRSVSDCEKTATTEPSTNRYRF